MPDISDVIATAGRDPLAIVFGLFVLGGLATRLLFREYPAGRAIVRVAFLILLTIAFIHADIVPYRPPKLAGPPLTDAVHAILKIAWWLWAAWLLVGLLRAFVVTEHRPHEGKLLQDLLAGAIYLAAAFAIIAYVFNLPVQGLLATSGVIAIVLGLALQSTLSDVFSGIVLDLSRPYRPGDWISIEGGTDGRVIEINWRATHVLTAKRDLAIVPNSTIAKAKIVNASSPTTIHGMTITIQLEPSTPPLEGKEILKTALLNCRLVLATPTPSVIVKSITAAYIEFDVIFFVENLGVSGDAQDKLFDLVFRHLFVSGISIASSENQPDPGQSDKNSRPALTAAEKLLQLVAIFKTLTADERNSIAAKLKPASYDQGETLVEPSQVLKSLFIVGSGVLSATRDESECEMELERFGPGDHYGEIGMLTGAPATTKITALVPATVYELGKKDLAPILEARPQVAKELGRALARRQAATHLTTPAELGPAVPTNALAAWFSDRLHRLYGMANADG
jgi:small-conductance mechanosensitive channel